MFVSPVRLSVPSLCPFIFGVLMFFLKFGMLVGHKYLLKFVIFDVFSSVLFTLLFLASRSFTLRYIRI